MNDTTAEFNKIYFQRLANMSLAAKARYWNQLNLTARSLALAGIKQRHPNCTSAEHYKILATQSLGADFTMKYFKSENQARLV